MVIVGNEQCLFINPKQPVDNKIIPDKFCIKEDSYEIARLSF